LLKTCESYVPVLQIDSIEISINTSTLRGLSHNGGEIISASTFVPTWVFPFPSTSCLHMIPFAGSHHINIPMSSFHPLSLSFQLAPHHVIWTRLRSLAESNVWPVTTDGGNGLHMNFQLSSCTFGPLRCVSAYRTLNTQQMVGFFDPTGSHLYRPCFLSNTVLPMTFNRSFAASV
jgi:hypothetical protein